MADDYPIELHPDKKYGLFQNPLSLEAQRKKFNKKYLSGASLGQDNNPHSILLPPKTNAGWCVDLQTIGKYEQIITDVFIVFEYATIFGNAAMIRIKVKNLAFNVIKENFESLSRDASKKQPVKKTTMAS